MQVPEVAHPGSVAFGAEAGHQQGSSHEVSPIPSCPTAAACWRAHMIHECCGAPRCRSSTSSRSSA